MDHWNNASTFQFNRLLLSEELEKKLKANKQAEIYDFGVGIIILKGLNIFNMLLIRLE